VPRAVLLLALLSAACDTGLPEEDDGAGPRRPPPEPTWAWIETYVFPRSCALSPSCHEGPTPAGRLDLRPGVAYDALLDAGHVVPGDPEASFLVDKLRGRLQEGEGDPMPLANEPLPEEVIQAIEEWIAAGAAR
jgi:hypothetical protein